MRGSASRSDHAGNYIWGFAPYPNRGGMNPRDPKKPNCMGFRLSNIDSEQGCRRQPCYLLSANCSYSLSAIFSNNKSAVQRTYCETFQSKLVFRACFCYLWEQRCLLSQVKRQSCLKVTLKSIRRISRAWSTHFAFPLAGAIKRKGWILKEGKEIFLFPFLEPIRGCVKGLLTEKQSLHVLLATVRQTDGKA